MHVSNTSVVHTHRPRSPIPYPRQNPAQVPLPTCVQVVPALCACAMPKPRALRASRRDRVHADSAARLRAHTGCRGAAAAGARRHVALPAAAASPGHRGVDAGGAAALPGGGRGSVRPGVAPRELRAARAARRDRRG